MSDLIRAIGALALLHLSILVGVAFVRVWKAKP